MSETTKISFVPTRTVVPHGDGEPYPTQDGYTDWVAVTDPLTNQAEFLMEILAVIDDSELGDEEELGFVVVDHTEVTGADVWYHWPARTVIDAALDAGHRKAGTALVLAYEAARNAWIASRIELLRQRFPNGVFDDTIRLDEELTLKSLLEQYELK